MLLVILQFCKMWVNIEICVAYWQFDQNIYVFMYLNIFIILFMQIYLFLHVPILDRIMNFVKFIFIRCQTKAEIAYKYLQSRFEDIQFKSYRF